MYPPPSLQALLHAYLIENVNMIHKHSLVVYFVLDLAMVLDQETWVNQRVYLIFFLDLNNFSHMTTITQFIKFPAVFKLSQSIIKITQAFWQLDHEDFSVSCTYKILSLCEIKAKCILVVSYTKFTQKAKFKSVLNIAVFKTMFEYKYCKRLTAENKV